MARPKTLKGVLGFLNRIPYINFGGCGISALAIYKWLEKRDQLKEDTRIVYYYNDENDYKTNYRLAKTRRKYKSELPLAPSHAVLWHDGKYIDSAGENNEYFNYEQYIKNPEFVLQSINNKGDWNWTFDRCNIPKIESGLDIKLNIKGW